MIDGYPARMFCGFAASGCVVASLVLYRRFGLGLLPLAGLASWMISRTLADVVTHATALRLYLGRGLSPEEVTALARLAQHVGVTGYALALASWGFSATRSMARSHRAQLDRDAWSSFWPLIPTLVVSTSAPFEPSLVVRFPQQAPEAIWSEVPDINPITWPDGDGDIPFFHTRMENVVTSVLTRDGDLHVFQGGRHEQLRFDVLAAPADPFWTNGVELVVDARATVGDLRRAARVLRQFAELSIVWRSNRLHEASSAARDRWGFVELAGRALRSRSIELITEGACDEDTIGSGPTLRRRCVVEAAPPSGRFESADVFLIESADDVSLGDWLVANASVEEIPALLVPGAGLGPHERLESIGGSDRPMDPLSTRVTVPDLAGGLAAGALLFVVGVLVGVLRELATVRGLLRRGFIRGVAGEAHEHLPSWVPAHLATLRILREEAGGPYRAESEVDVADEATSWRELRGIATRLAGTAVRGASTWLVVAVVAGAVGLVLPLLLPGR